MNVFERLKRGEAADPKAEKLLADEIARARRACDLLNLAEPGTKDYEKGWMRLFDGRTPKGISAQTPCWIDFPKQITWGRDIVIGRGFTAQAVAGIAVEDGVRIGPQVTIVTETPDVNHPNLLQGKGVVIGEGAVVGARAVILPGVHIGVRAVVRPGAVVAEDVPEGAEVVGNPARPIQA
jgi:acetyltransferase-like isoleucine patch superfamily enzyme